MSQYQLQGVMQKALKQFIITDYFVSHTADIFKIDQRQISLCNINAYSTPEITRNKDMITQGEFS